MADSSPTEPVTPATPATPKRTKPDTVRLATVTPYSTFDTGLPDQPVITNAGSDIPKSQLDAVLTAAANTAVELKEI